MALTSVVTCKFLIFQCSLLDPRDAHLYNTFSIGIENFIMNNKYIRYRSTYYLASYIECQVGSTEVNLLKTKRRPLYLKTESVPRCKHFSSRL
jgi:hypothetical protein